MKRVDISEARNINMIAMGGGDESPNKIEKVEKVKKPKKEKKTKSHSVSNFVYYKMIYG
jgi:hypothetical protein